MCRFTIKVRLCGCVDPNCKQQVGTFNEVVSERYSGHISSIVEYRRTSPMCLDGFLNTDPKRAVLQAGRCADHIGSEEDCKGAKKNLVEVVRRDLSICDSCERDCAQPGYTAADADLMGRLVITSKRHYEHMWYRERKHLGKKETEAQDRVRRLRKKIAWSMVPNATEAERDAGDEIDVSELLSAEERELVVKFAPQIRKNKISDMKYQKAVEKLTEKMGGMLFTDEEFEEADENAVPSVRRYNSFSERGRTSDYGRRSESRRSSDRRRSSERGGNSGRRRSSERDRSNERGRSRRN